MRLVAVIALGLCAACDPAALGGPDYEPIPDGFKRARSPLPDPVLIAIADYGLPVESVITRDGCYYTHIEPDRPDLVAPLRTSQGARICTQQQ